MTKYDTIVAIDPDVDKSGVAELNPLHRLLEVTSLSFPQLIDYLQTRQKLSDTAKTSLLVVVEAGWLNSISNFHTTAGRKGQRIAKNVGANHQVGKMIVEMCEYYAIPVVIAKPLKKTWKGKDGKITQEEIALFTGITGRTNQEGRDAALLAWVYAGLPIRTTFLNR
jgi:hypothetical protein